ncbi:MAG: Gfo/Idh/MocA family oxidoreductase [Paracoccaceae bacterium]|nr:Gfo/Idh/MocA family oxidoreductase [Paracoccaceae bacterium]
MQKKLKYGMIGCGMMGQEHIRNIQLLPDVEIIAVVEPDAGMRAIVADMLPDADLYEDLPPLWERDDLDCLVVGSPNFRHVEHLEAITKNSDLPVLMEKPLYTDAADAVKLRKMAVDHTAPIWVAMEYRYMPMITALVDKADGVTGGIKMLTIREHRFPFLTKVGDWNRFSNQSGGTLVEKCCHHFDLMRLMMGCDPVRVMASAGQDANHLDEVYEGRQSDILDNGYVIVDFENGARAMLELCMFAEGSRYQEEITAVGPNGKIECFVPGPGRFWPTEMGAAPIAKLVESPRSPMGPRELDIPVDPDLLEAGDHNGSTFYQHQKFNAAVRGKCAVEVSVNDGDWAVAMGLAAQKSAETGQSVLMGEFI